VVCFILRRSTKKHFTQKSRVDQLEICERIEWRKRRCFISLFRYLWDFGHHESRRSYVDLVHALLEDRWDHLNWEQVVGVMNLAKSYYVDLWYSLRRSSAFEQKKVPEGRLDSTDLVGPTGTGNVKGITWSIGQLNGLKK
jgi:hypothetical protein